VTGFRTGAIDLREAAIASALAGVVVVALGYASGLGVPVRNEASATLAPPQAAPQTAPPATSAPMTAAPPVAMAMPPAPAGGMGEMAGAAVTPGMDMAGMDMDGAGAHGGPAPAVEPPATPATPESPTTAECADLLAQLPTSDLPLVGSLTGSTATSDGLLGGLLGGATSLTGSLTAPVTDLLTTPLAGGEKSAPPCLLCDTAGSTVSARETTR